MIYSMKNVTDSTCLTLYRMSRNVDRNMVLTDVKLQN